jgi:hypothetical protein
MASKDQKDIERVEKLIREVQAQSPPGTPQRVIDAINKGFRADRRCKTGCLRTSSSLGPRPRRTRRRRRDPSLSRVIRSRGRRDRSTTADMPGSSRSGVFHSGPGRFFSCAMPSDVLAFRPPCDEIASTTKTRQGAMWRELVGLIFLVLLFGAALMANVTDGPMRDHRGAWVTQASK